MTFVIKDGKITDPLLDGIIDSVTPARAATHKTVVAVIGAAVVSAATAAGIAWSSLSPTGAAAFAVDFTNAGVAAKPQTVTIADPVVNSAPKKSTNNAASISIRINHSRAASTAAGMSM